MLYLATIKPETLGVLRRIQSLPLLQQTRLVGGAALALLMGHRLSVDLDFFGDWGGVDLTPHLENVGKVVRSGGKINLQFYRVDDVKADFVAYDFPWLEPPLLTGGLRLAQYKDIAAMKLSAITNRGSRKDFIDLAFLLQRYSLEEMLAWYQAKYPQGSAYLVLRSLAYFEDAEEEPQPVMLQPLSWTAVKAEISAAVRAFA